jgi:acyl-CoA reductase-like NAD-dependent aldehyde dehydrogenase
VTRANELARRLESGTAWVNDHGTISPTAPFGGAKQSGIGVEFGSWGLEENMQLQTVRINRQL